MKNLLTICDLYGENFHWYIGFKPKYYTYYGGIFSILSFLSIFGIFYLFGYNDFKRKNPISNTSTVPPTGYKNIKFGKEKLYLPWRIIDYDENPINISRIIYPKIYYFTVQPDNITGELLTKYNLINYKLCNETSMKYLGKEYIIDIPIETLYCIDMEDLDVGGSWNTDFLNFIRFDLYMCEDGIDYNETNPKCTTYEKLEKIHGGGESVFFELLYPVIQFQPINFEVPILILYRTYYYIFNKFSNKLDRIYLQEHVLEDDQSLLFNKPVNRSYWGVNYINGESYIIGEKDVLRFSSTSKLYTLNIYFDLGIAFFTRKYKKLYEILGEIFPIISALCSVFSFFAKILNELKAAKTLNEYLLGYDNNKQTNNLVNKNKSTKHLKLYGEMTIHNNNINKNSLSSNSLNIIRRKEFNLKDNSNQIIPINNHNNLEDSSKIFCNQNNINININAHRKKNFKRNSNIIINSPKKTNHEALKKKKEKYPLHYYFFGYLYTRVNKSKINKNRYLCISDRFYKSFTYFRHLIDISSYISLHKEFRLLKRTVNEKLNLNEIDSFLIDSKKNINLLYSVSNYIYKNKLHSNKNIKKI